jgi:hypothetical protein
MGPRPIHLCAELMLAAMEYTTDETTGISPADCLKISRGVVFRSKKPPADTTAPT